jgi:hypothetical protein
MTIRSRVADSTILKSNSWSIDTFGSLLLHVYDYHWQIMSYNVIKKMT